MVNDSLLRIWQRNIYPISHVCCQSIAAVWQRRLQQVLMLLKPCFYLAKKEPLGGAASLWDRYLRRVISSVATALAWAILKKNPKTYPESKADGWAGGTWSSRFVLSLWHLEYWTSLCCLDAFIFLSSYRCIIKETKKIIFPLVTQKRIKVCFLLQNIMKYGTLTFEKTWLSTRADAVSPIWSHCFIPLWALELLKVLSGVTAKPQYYPRDQCMLASFQKPLWEPYHAFLPILLIITYDFDA